MKKVCRNIFAAIAAVALVSSFASCSDGSSDDEVENPKPEDGTSVAGEEITFVAVADSTNSEDTVLFVKYDRSAKGADELIKISNAELKISVNGNVTKTYNSITFALDEYGASFSGKEGPLTDNADMKEYKTKLPVGAQVKKGDTVKVVLTKGSVSGAGKDKVDLTGVVVALIDKAEKVSYYKELAENEYLPLIKVEDKKIEDKKPEEKKEEVKPEEEKKSEAEKKPEESQEQKPAEKTDEQKPAEGSEGQNTQPSEENSENGAGGESQTEDTSSTWTFPVTAASTDNDNTVLLIKYNRSAAGADELISISDAELKVWKNDTLIKTFDSISFALDNYGASFDDSDKNPIKNASNMKEYKVKLPIETTVASGDNVKVEFTKGTISGAGKDKVKAGEDIVVALVDIAPTAGYYKELCANTNEYKAIFGKATVSTAAEPASNVIWTGIFDLMNWSSGSGTIEAANFSNASAGMKLVFTVEQNEANDYHCFKLAYNGGEWGDCPLGDPSVTDGNKVEVDFSSSTVFYTLTASDATNLKASGLGVFGHGVKITKVELVTE